MQGIQTERGSLCPPEADVLKGRVHKENERNFVYTELEGSALRKTKSGKEDRVYRGGEVRKDLAEVTCEQHRSEGGNHVACGQMHLQCKGAGVGRHPAYSWNEEEAAVRRMDGVGSEQGGTRWELGQAQTDTSTCLGVCGGA